MDGRSEWVFARNVYKYRKLRKLSQFQLSQLSGIPQGHISQLERGKFKDMYLTRGYALAHALGVTIEEMMEQEV
jgi:transcriptional regulator with XRE-family HTH domain